MAKKLIGTTKIELKNIRTGETTTVTESNMLTSRLNKILSQNPFGALKGADLCPIAHKVLGGIVLFPESQSEDRGNDLIFEGEADTTGYARNTTDTTGDAYCGYIKTTETGPIEGGYKWVYEWDSAQGNGTIASVSLASPNVFQSLFTVDAMVMGCDDKALYKAHAYDKETGHFYYVDLDKSGNIKIAKTKRPAYNIPLAQANSFANWGVPYTTEEIIIPKNEKTVIEESASGIPVETKIADYKVYSGNRNINQNYVNSVSFKNDGGTPYIYIFSVMQGSSTVEVTKINMQSNAVEDYYTLNLSLENGMYLKVGTLGDSTDDTTNWRNGVFTKDYFAFVDDYLYIYTTNILYNHNHRAETHNILKVNAHDETDISIVGSWTDTEGTCRELYYGIGVIEQNSYGWKYTLFARGEGETCISLVNGELVFGQVNVFSGLIINADNIVCLDDTYALISEDDFQYVARLTQYKATINNLETPVVKTINEQMKITYIIKEIDGT